MKIPPRLPSLIVLVACLLILAGCPPARNNGGASKADLTDPLAPRVRRLEFSDPVTVRPDEFASAVTLQSARNETVTFSLQLDQLTRKNPALNLSLQIQPLKAEDGQIDATQFLAYQILPMPVETNRAGFVRHTGLAAGPRKLPRALLPLTARNGATSTAASTIPLEALRDSSEPFSPVPVNLKVSPRRVESAQLWIDLTVPPTTKAGAYLGSVQVVLGDQIVAELPVKLNVFDFVIPDERHLAMVGRLDWDRLKTHYKELFETTTPEYLTRKEQKYSEAIRTLDSIVKLGQQHRAQVVIPNLQPQVKWSVTKPPQFDWADFDSVTLPWLKGTAFTDKVPIGYWPLPAEQFVFNYNEKSQAQYWAAVSSHFDQLDLLSHAPLSPIPSNRDRRGPATPRDAIDLSQYAARLMEVHQGVQIQLPLEDDQLDFSQPGNPKLGIDPTKTDRLMTNAPGIVFAAPSNPWPAGVKHPAHLLRTDIPGLIPYAGAGGDDRDIRLWAWLAFLRNASVVQWDSILPGYSDPSQMADPNEMVWFYPGHWFGTADPLPTVQLKWLRRAAFDYEYLLLAFQRGEKINAYVMARCLAKQVQTLRQAPDPTYALMTGTTDARAWETGRELLARLIVARVPGQTIDESQRDVLTQITGEMLQWTTALEKPLLLGRTTSWGWGVGKQNGNWADLKLGVDIYNAAGVRLIGELKWAAVPPGSAWEIAPEPVAIPPNLAVGTFNVRRVNMDASVNLDLVGPLMRQPISLGFANALGGPDIILKAICPVAACEKLEGAGRVRIDGDLNEWTAADALHDGKLVEMLNRPTVQQQEIKFAAKPSQVFSGWAADHLYLGFKVEGTASQEGGGGRNFTEYQFRRAWGEDLVEVLVQPVYADNVLGPVLHVTCKPRGQSEVESKADPKANINPWQSLVGVNLRYACTQEGPTWRGELAIPWDAINDEKHKNLRPTLLRFNFVQHVNATGESSSWAGPLDFGRDDSFMGLLYLRQPALAGKAEKFYEEK